MTKHSIDIQYAYIQLGLDIDASFERVQKVLLHAKAYRYFTKARLEHVEKFVTFFAERQKLGELHYSFEEIRKAYRRKAFDLHPDRNKESSEAEEELKSINSAYGIVEKIHREARAYFKKSEQTRNEIKEAACRATAQETPFSNRQEGKTEQKSSKTNGAAHSTKDNKYSAHAKPDSKSAQSIKYVAASVPRYIRNKRLFYLPFQAVIGSKFVKHGNHAGLVYDVMMLPEKEFIRARLNLGIEGSGTPELSMSQLTPTYIPLDAQELLVPVTEAEPYNFARAYFTKRFELTPNQGEN